MNTRNKGNYNRGFYRKLNNQTIITLEKHHPHVQKIPINYNKFISKINEQILKKLKYSKKTSPVCIFKIDIEENIYTYLKEQFNITGRFKTNIAFHESFQTKSDLPIIETTVILIPELFRLKYQKESHSITLKKI